MKKLYSIMLCLGLFTLLQLPLELWSQCPDCEPDTTCGQGESFPTICPEILPSGTSGEYYEQVLTFFLPATVEDQGITATLDEITISSITGVPFGMEITVNDDDNIFYPNDGDNYGCATLCGTPLLSGPYDITINVVVIATAFGFEQELNESFIIPLIIEEGELSNTSFSFDQAVGCGELEVAFQALIDGSPNPTEYQWDFGNGNQSDDPNPSMQSYGPGTYLATLETTIYEFVLTQIIISSLNGDGANDADEIFGLLAQDPYVVVLNENNAAVYTSDVINGSNSATFSGLSVIISNPNYTVQVWDSDAITADDLIGEYTISELISGIFSFNDGGTQGSINIEQQINSQFFDTQEINVFDIPNGEFIHDQELNQLVYDDESLIEFEWTLNDEVLGNESSIQPLDQPGVYQCTVLSESGCEAISSEFTLCPEIDIDIDFENELFSTDTGFESYSWSYNGLPVADEDSFEIAYQGPGNYAVTITTDYGCTVTSEVLTIDLNISELPDEPFFTVYPNPVSEMLFLNYTGTLQVDQISIIDTNGKMIQQYYHNQLNEISNGIDVSHLPSGVYVINLMLEDQPRFSRTFIK